MNVTAKYSMERWIADPRGYVADRMKSLPLVSEQVSPEVWRSLNSQTTCDSHVDFGEVGYPAYFTPGMFVDEFIAAGSVEEAAMEGLALLNLGVFGWDMDSLTMVKLEGQGFGTNETWWAKFSKVPT